MQNTKEKSSAALYKQKSLELKENITKHINEFIDDAKSAVEDRSHKSPMRTRSKRTVPEQRALAQTNSLIDKNYTASDTSWQFSN